MRGECKGDGEEEDSLTKVGRSAEPGSPLYVCFNQKAVIFPIKNWHLLPNVIVVCSNAGRIAERQPHNVCLP